MELKLNIGCGDKILPGYVNIDKFDTFSPDLVWDLEKTPYPFKDNSVTEIFASHVMEHIGQTTDSFLNIMKEFYRILVIDGIVDIKVPHPRSDGFIGDPTHVRIITPVIFNLFSKKKCKEFAEKNWPNSRLADYLDVDFEIVKAVYVLQPQWIDKFKEMNDNEQNFYISTYYNIVDEIQIILKKAS